MDGAFLRLRSVAGLGASKDFGLQVLEKFQEKSSFSTPSIKSSPKRAKGSDFGV